jgi:hypothetical protein
MMEEIGKGRLPISLVYFGSDCPLLKEDLNIT